MSTVHSQGSSQQFLKANTAWHSCDAQFGTDKVNSKLFFAAIVVSSTVSHEYIVNGKKNVLRNKKHKKYFSHISM